jgi:ABC-type Mn2+/Zn2+ transport system permease subunit
MWSMYECTPTFIISSSVGVSVVIFGVFINVYPTTDKTQNVIQDHSLVIYAAVLLKKEATSSCKTSVRE